MRFQPNLLRTSFPILFILLLSTLITAQEEQPAPQFLYRDDNRLVLLDGYTGETTELPIEVSDGDRFEWSPDGEYLLAWIQEDEIFQYCLNLYDVDTESWLYDKPISCSVQTAKFSLDGQQLVYATTDKKNAVLWQYMIESKNTVELYRTTEGDELRPEGIADIEWSPTGVYLVYVRYRWSMGGTNNTFIVMDVTTQDHFTVQGGWGYYASYQPIWSEDNRWFLMILQEEYVTSGAIPHTNHQGDVYLVNSATGKQYRLTYTPAIYEYNLRWTEDGNIAYDEMIYQEFNYSFTLEEAMKIEPLPDEEIVMPEPFEVEDFFDPLQGVLVAPDPNIGAWTSSSRTSEGNYIHQLSIGNILSSSRTASFTVTVKSSTYATQDVMIGWRPSDYPYGMG